MRVYVRIAAGIAAAALGAAALWAQAPGTPRVTYARSFKGSVPVFLQIEVYQDGHAVYTARAKDGDPEAHLAFTASPAAVEEIFSAAAALQDFSSPRLQSRQEVAYTGQKMLAFDDSTRHAAQQFTYTTDKHAVRLVSLFEAISVTGMDTLRLQRALQYQPLDVLQIMNQIQDDWSGRQMAEPQLLAPTLAAAAANSGVMAAAQSRARKLLREFARKR